MVERWQWWWKQSPEFGQPDLPTTHQLAPVQSLHDFFPSLRRGSRAADGHGGPRLNSRGPGSLAAARPLPARYGSNQMLAAENSPGMRRDVFAPWTG